MKLSVYFSSTGDCVSYHSYLYLPFHKLAGKFMFFCAGRWFYCFPKPHHLLRLLNPAWFYLSGTSLHRLSWKRGKTSLDLNETRDGGVLGWQWHQLDHMHIDVGCICIMLHIIIISRDGFYSIKLSHQRAALYISRIWYSQQCIVTTWTARDAGCVLMSQTTMRLEWEWEWAGLAGRGRSLLPCRSTWA